MIDILPIFRSHYSLGGSVLTLEEPGKSKLGNPLSVFDLAQEANLQKVMIVDSRIDGFLQAYKNCQKAWVPKKPKTLEEWKQIHQSDEIDDSTLTEAERTDIRKSRAEQDYQEEMKRYEERVKHPPLNADLCYGLKLCVCADMGDRTIESRKTESKVVVLIRNSVGYSDLLRIWNRAWGHEGSFEHRGTRYGRADWKMLKTHWTENLGLALPFFSSFIARNTLTFSQITPDLPIQPWIFKEVDSQLPFSPLIDSAIARYTGGDSSMVVPSKTILYARPEDFKAFVVFRAVHLKSSFDKPEQSHLSSDRFSFAAWKELTSTPSLS